MKHFMNVFFALLGLTMGVRAQTHEISVNAVEQPPKIDGFLSEPIWQRPPDAADFKHLNSGAPAREPTDVWIAHDGAWLFVAYRCRESTPATIECSAKARDQDMRQDDAVELFISPGAQGKPYWRFAVNAAGAQDDSRSEGANQGIPWDGHWRSAARIETNEGCWTVEMAVPLFYLTGAQATSSFWKVNFNRIRRHSPPEFSSWAPMKGSFHKPARFGILHGLAGMHSAPVFAPVIKIAGMDAIQDIPVQYYELKVEIENHGASAGTAQVWAVDILEEHETQTAPRSTELAGGSSQTVTIKVPIAEIAIRRAWAIVGIDDGLGAWRFEREAIQGDHAIPPLRINLNQSYYTTEANAFLTCRLNLPQPMLDNIRIAVKIADTEINAALQPRSGTERVKLPLITIAPGRHHVCAQVETLQGQLVCAETVVLTKRPPAPVGNDVKTDRWHGGLIVNDRPFFPIGFVGVPPGDFPILARMGMNANIPWGRGSPFSDLQAALDQARQYQIKIMPLPDTYLLPRIRRPDRSRMLCTDADWAEMLRQGITERLPDYLVRLKNHPSLLAWYGPDEPCGDLAHAVCREMKEAVEAGDGRHPFVLLFSGMIASTWSDAYDICMADIYMLPSATGRMPNSWLEMFVRARTTAQNLQKPLWLTIAGEYWSRSPRRLLPREQRLNTYLALVHDVQGIFYFLWPVTHKDTFQMFKTLAAEINALAPVLLQRSPPQEVESDGLPDEPVRVLLKNRPDGGQLLLAANTWDQPILVSYALSSITGDMSVVNAFVPTNYPVRDGRFEDCLEGYGTRAYLINAAPPPADQKVQIKLTLTAVTNAGNPSNTNALSGAAPMTAGRNVLFNSSFEHASLPKLPDYWGVTPGFSIPENRLTGHPDAWIYLDDSTCRDGNVSLRLQGNCSLTPWPTRPNIATSVEPDTPYVFSIYLKAKPAPVKVQIFTLGVLTNVMVGTEWSRFHVSGKTATNQSNANLFLNVMGGADPDAAATVWADAAQLEIGAEPTSYVLDTWNPGVN